MTEEYSTGAAVDHRRHSAPVPSSPAQGGPSWSHYYGWRGDLLATAAGHHLVFPALSGGLETLWSSDGTAAGSRPIADTRIGVSSIPDRLTPFRDGLLAAACTDGQPTRNAVRPPGPPTRRLTETVNLLSRPVTDCSSSLVLRMVALDTTAVFLTQSDRGLALWGTDGTAAGTQAIVPAARADEPEDVVRYGTKAAFTAARPPGHQGPTDPSSGSPTARRPAPARSSGRPGKPGSTP